MVKPWFAGRCVVIRLLDFTYGLLSCADRGLRRGEVQPTLSFHTQRVQSREQVNDRSRVRDEEHSNGGKDDQGANLGYGGTGALQVTIRKRFELIGKDQDSTGFVLYANKRTRRLIFAVWGTAQCLLVVENIKKWIFGIPLLVWM